VTALVKTLYEDLAAHSRIQGVLFQDDAYLTDTEDFHPSALVRYKEFFGRDLISEDFDGNPGLMKSWTRYKTESLIGFIDGLKQAVRKYRPRALFARNLYARVLEEPGSERRFAQDYELFLENYDRVVVMAYPQMEKVRHPSDWLIDLVGRSKDYSGGIEKTVFKVQAYDWRKEVWIKDRALLEELRDVLSSGGRHIAYYPDNFRKDRPALNVIKLEMSTRDFPFIP
jgi:biofilm PGA synthesis lipoprotein PgaB